MSTLVELNNFSDGIINYSDVRPSNVLFNFPAATNLTDVVLSTTSFTLQRTIDIVEIVQPTQALVSFVVDVSAVSGTTVTWGSLPSGVVISEAGGVYTVNGIDSVSDWEAVREPTITLPVDTQGSFEYECTIEYTNDGVRKYKRWTVGTFKAIAELTAVASITCDTTNAVTRDAVSNPIIVVTVNPVAYEMLIIARVTVECTGRAIYDPELNIETVSSITPDVSYKFGFTGSTAIGNPISGDGASSGENMEWGHIIASNGSYILGANKYSTATSQEKLNSATQYLLTSSYSDYGAWKVAESDVFGAVEGKTVKINSANISGMGGEDQTLSAQPYHIYLRKLSELDYTGPITDYPSSTFNDLQNTKIQWTSDMTTEMGYNYNGLGVHNRNFDMTDSHIALIDVNQETVYVIEYNPDNTVLSHAYKTFSFEKEYEKTLSGVTDFELVAITDDYFAATTSGTDIHVWNMSDGSFNRTITASNSDPQAIKIYNDMLMIAHPTASEVFDITTGSTLITLNGGSSIDASDFYVLIGDPSAAGEGKAYLYYRTDVWGTAGTLYKTFNNPNVTTTNVLGSQDDKFGTSVSCRDYEILIGAPGEDDSGNTNPYADWGTVYSFR